MITKYNEVILVDFNNTILGFEDKYNAHIYGFLHRAVSVFIVNKKKELMLQKRSCFKYHSPNLWSNTSCSHPRRYESVLESAVRCLHQEMGISNCFLYNIFNFIYKSPVLDNGMIEYEFDYIYIGFCDEIPKLNYDEASKWKFLDFSLLRQDIIAYPDNYTFWFQLIINKFFKKLNFCCNFFIKNYKK